MFNKALVLQIFVLLLVKFWFFQSAFFQDGCQYIEIFYQKFKKFRLCYVLRTAHIQNFMTFKHTVVLISLAAWNNQISCFCLATWFYHDNRIKILQFLTMIFEIPSSNINYFSKSSLYQEIIFRGVYPLKLPWLELKFS